MHAAHPLGISPCQIVVDRDDMHALARQRVQICRAGRYQRLALAGLHLRDTSLMQHDTAYELYGIMLHMQHSFRRLSHRGKCLREYGVEILSCGYAVLVLLCESAKLLIAFLLHLRLQCLDLGYYRADQLQFALAVRAE